MVSHFRIRKHPIIRPDAVKDPSDCFPVSRQDILKLFFASFAACNKNEHAAVIVFDQVATCQPGQFCPTDPDALLKLHKPLKPLLPGLTLTPAGLRRGSSTLDPARRPLRLPNLRHIDARSLTDRCQPQMDGKRGVSLRPRYQIVRVTLYNVP